MGFAHHGVYATWFEMGRSEMLRQSGVSYKELEERGELLPVVDLHIRYKKPARYDEVLRLRSTMAEVTRAKIVFEYELLRGEMLLATGKTVNACIDREGKLRSIPDVIFDAFEVEKQRKAGGR